VKPTPLPETTPAFSPSYDNKIFRKYSLRTLEAKMENKIALQKELGWVAEPKIPLLCLSGGMSDAQGGKELKEVLQGILPLHCQLLIRGVGSEEFGKLFTLLEKEYAHRIKILRDEETLRRKMYAASDLGLFFSSDDEAEIVNCLAYGAVPVSPSHPILQDYNPVQESGNAFVAEPHTSWTWFAALVRAHETYKLPYDFRTIQRHCMEAVQGNEEQD
jgi:starch synthase